MSLAWSILKAGLDAFILYNVHILSMPLLDVQMYINNYQTFILEHSLLTSIKACNSIQ
jgi:hypothetical protein